MPKGLCPLFPDDLGFTRLKHLKHLRPYECVPGRIGALYRAGTSVVSQARRKGPVEGGLRCPDGLSGVAQ